MEELEKDLQRLDNIDLSDDVDSDKGNALVVALVALTFTLMVSVSGGIGLALSGIRNPQDLVNNDRQYQEFSVCLSDLENVGQAVTAKLMMQKLDSGLACLQELPCPTQKEIKYQNLKSLSESLVSKDAESQISQQKQLASLVKEIDLKLLNKTISGWIANTFWTFVILSIIIATAVKLKDDFKP